MAQIYMYELQLLHKLRKIKQGPLALRLQNVYHRNGFAFYNCYHCFWHVACLMLSVQCSNVAAVAAGRCYVPKYASVREAMYVFDAASCWAMLNPLNYCFAPH